MAKEDNTATLQAEYNKGVSIQALADKYELDPAEVEKAVVTPVGEAPAAPVQPAGDETTDKKTK